MVKNYIYCVLPATLQEAIVTAAGRKCHGTDSIRRSTCPGLNVRDPILQTQSPFCSPWKLQSPDPTEGATIWNTSASYLQQVLYSRGIERVSPYGAYWRTCSTLRCTIVHVHQNIPSEAATSETLITTINESKHEETC